MEILIIILIVVLILQSGLYVYGHFFDIHANKENDAALSMMDTALKQYSSNIVSLQKQLQGRDDSIAQWSKNYNDLTKKFNQLVVFLPNAIQKESIRKVANGESTESDIEIIKEYYKWLQNIKYDDSVERYDEKLENHSDNETEDK